MLLTMLIMGIIINNVVIYFSDFIAMFERTHLKYWASFFLFLTFVFGSAVAQENDNNNTIKAKTYHRAEKGMFSKNFNSKIIYNNSNLNYVDI